MNGSIEVDVVLHSSWKKSIEFSQALCIFCIPTHRFHSSESIHEMIAEVLVKSLACHPTKAERQRHLNFLLTLDIPKLFELPSSDGPQTHKWLQKFEDDWIKHIQEKQLQVASQECLSTFLVSTICIMYCLTIPNVCFTLQLLLYDLMVMIGLIDCF